MIYTYLMNEDSIVAASSELRARSVVELPDPNAASVGNGGTTVTYRDETKYYTVRRGDTASSVAKKLGVSESSLKKWNKLRSGKLKKGAKLKYVKRVAVNVPAPTNVVNPQAEQPAVETPAPTPQTAEDGDEFTPLPEITDADVNTTTDAAPAPAPAAKPAATAKETKAKETSKAKETAAAKSKKEKEKAKAPATKNHKVKKGETLYKISKQYGVTVEEIQKANGLKNANIKPDQSIKIPIKK
jgi:membrane-bound lytic murein transglycosylase D